MLSSDGEATILKFFLIGTFPLEIDFASHPVGSYTLHIQATDVFNLTDEDSTKYTSMSHGNLCSTDTACILCTGIL